ncbi:DUF1302 domain-containing protein [Pseudoduganella umbonata]|uniref:DUF1302 domain-containing protein n=1 Tax=Pseudoduganella umbonata TaxID=864828 RepID=A0A4P8HK05_9BURK|nr:DUF1302 family protein [Pseudoduganella umbonata]MBB3219929.1 hypothetical protein [Pseudoduganella umbonata]QCP09943.1 DUF1302 domain-containing protein [Pseudoduganella umbonata]
MHHARGIPTHHASGISILAGQALRGIAAAVAMLCAGTAPATEIAVSNPDLKVRLDATVRYTGGWRTEKPDSRLLGNYIYDEGDAKFDRGDMVTNRLDLLTEFDISYKNKVGARVSAAAWYDQAYDDHTVSSPAGFATAYRNNRYNSEVERYVNGPSGEILDAFVWANLELGKVPVNIKVGRQTNVWGEGLLLGAHAISYGQSPVDGVKAATNPGVETKEVFLPVGQVHLSTQVTDNLTLVGQYYYEWKPTRIPHAGTYLMGADTAPSSDFLAFPVAGVAARIDQARKPGQHGNWGIGARLNVEAIESTFGAYYRRFDDYSPELGVQLLDFRGPLPTRARFLYPEDVKQASLSFGRVIQTVAVGVELSHRKNGALNTPSSVVTETGARGDTWHAVVNGIYMLPATPVWDTGSFVAELAYNRLDKVVTNPALYRSVGSAACVDSRTGKAGSGNKDDGCSTRDAWLMALKMTPQYLNVLPSWDLSIPLSITYGLSGNAPTSGGGTEGELRWSLGATMTYASKYEFSLSYADRTLPVRELNGRITGGAAHSNSSVGVIDRGWLSFTFKTAF